MFHKKVVDDTLRYAPGSKVMPVFDFRVPMPKDIAIPAKSTRSENASPEEKVSK